MAAIYIVNTTTDERGRTVPNLPAGTSWVGNLYEKTGNVRKYLLKTDAAIAGLPGVFGPVPPEDVAAAIDADGGTTRGWVVDDVPYWAIGGQS